MSIQNLRQLRDPVGTLEAHRNEIIAALDFSFTGY